MVTSEGLSHEDLSYVEKGKTCKDLLKMFPERYSSEGNLAKALGFAQSKITEWINTYEAWSSASGCDATLAKEVEIISKPKKDKSGKGKNLLSSETFKEISVAFKEDPKKVAEVTKEAAKRGVTRSQIRAVKKTIKSNPKMNIKQALDITQGKIADWITSFDSYSLANKVDPAAKLTYRFSLKFCYHTN